VPQLSKGRITVSLFNKLFGKKEKSKPSPAPVVVPTPRKHVRFEDQVTRNQIALEQLQENKKMLYSFEDSYEVAERVATVALIVQRDQPGATELESFEYDLNTFKYTVDDCLKLQTETIRLMAIHAPAADQTLQCFILDDFDLNKIDILPYESTLMPNFENHPSNKFRKNMTKILETVEAAKAEGYVYGGMASFAKDCVVQ
jgi:hypothetical protein